VAKSSSSRIARILVVVWTLISIVNAFAGDCENLVDSIHVAAVGSAVPGHGDHGEGDHGTHEHGKNAADGKEGADSCCCVKLTATSAAVRHDASPPSESRSHAQPDPALLVGVSPPPSTLLLARFNSGPSPRSRTPLFLLHLRLLN